MFKNISTDDPEYNRVMENLAKQYLFALGHGGTSMIHTAHCQIGNSEFIILLDGEKHSFPLFTDMQDYMRKFLRWNGFDKEDVDQFMAAVKEVWDLTVGLTIQRCDCWRYEWERFSEEDIEHIIIKE